MMNNMNIYATKHALSRASRKWIFILGVVTFISISLFVFGAHIALGGGDGESGGSDGFSSSSDGSFSGGSGSASFSAGPGSGGQGNYGGSDGRGGDSFDFQGEGPAMTGRSNNTGEMYGWSPMADNPNSYSWGPVAQGGTDGQGESGGSGVGGGVGGGSGGGPGGGGGLGNESPQGFQECIADSVEWWRCIDTASSGSGGGTSGQGGQGSGSGTGGSPAPRPDVKFEEF